MQNVTIQLFNGKNEVVQKVVVENPDSCEVFAVRLPTPVFGVNQCLISRPYNQTDKDCINLNAVQVYDKV